MSLAFVTVGVAAFTALALVLPKTAAGRRRVLRWIIGPLVIVAFGVNWFFMWLGLGLQENCAPDCVTHDDVSAARAAFIVVTVVWLVGLTVDGIRRRGGFGDR